jgi:mannose-6-phosphate isomerase-like protein (cupin superfamily)
MTGGNRFDALVRPAFVISESDVEGRRLEGDTAVEKTVFDASNGCELLTQRVVRFGPGRSLPRGDDELDELLYVHAGRGSVEIDGAEHPLEPDAAIHVRAGERYVVVNEGESDVAVVSVLVPVESGPERRHEPVVRFAERPEERADAKRTFRVLHGEDTGAPNVTQFLGIVEPCRAPDHSHSYDEVGYVVAGRGLAHVGGESIPLGPGSCFHLPPEQVHCIENTGPETMRILGVFHPSGSPASRSYDEAAPSPKGGNR